MLNFLRNLRRDVGTGNLFYRYMLYAVGEILLVVIGILIALQVNNWNEKKINQRAIHAALQEVRQDLILDTLQLNKTIEIRSEDLKAQSRVIQVLEQKQTFNDQTYRDLGRVMLQRQTKLLTNGYDLVQELGVSNLNNREIRNVLVEYYEWSLAWIEKEIADDTFEFESTWLPYVRQNFKEWEFNETGIPKNDLEISEDSYLLISLKINLENLNMTLKSHQYALKTAKTLIRMIDKILCDNTSSCPDE